MRKQIVVLIVIALVTSGCVRALVNASMNRHYSAPDIADLTLPPSADGELVYYFGVLQDYGNSFENHLGKVNPTESLKTGVNEEVYQKVAESLMNDYGYSRVDALRMAKASQKQAKNMNIGKTGALKSLPPGASSGLIAVGNQTSGSSFTYPSVSSSVTVSYVVGSFEKAVDLRRAMFQKFAQLGLSSSGWNVEDEAFHHERNQTIYQGMKNAQGYQKGLTEKERAEGESKVQAWKKKINEIPDTISYKYLWESDVDNKKSGVKNTDQLVINFQTVKVPDEKSGCLTIQIIYSKTLPFS